MLESRSVRGRVQPKAASFRDRSDEVSDRGSVEALGTGLIAASGAAGGTGWGDWAGENAVQTKTIPSTPLTRVQQVGYRQSRDGILAGFAVGILGTVVGGFLRDGDVMGMAFSHTRGQVLRQIHIAHQQ